MGLMHGRRLCVRRRWLTAGLAGWFAWCPFKVTYDDVVNAAYIDFQPPGTRATMTYPRDPQRSVEALPGKRTRTLLTLGTPIGLGPSDSSSPRAATNLGMRLTLSSDFGSVLIPIT